MVLVCFYDCSLYALFPTGFHSRKGIEGNHGACLFLLLLFVRVVSYWFPLSQRRNYNNTNLKPLQFATCGYVVKQEKLPTCIVPDLKGFTVMAMDDEGS